MLDKLSKQHSKWINFAFKISKNKNIAEDLVQDMYLKVHYKEIPEHKLTDTYIYIILLNDFRESIKKTNKVNIVSIDDCYNLIDNFNTFELDDKGFKCLENINNIKPKNKRLFLNSMEMSIEALAVKEGITRQSVFRRLQRIKIKLKQTQ